MFLNKRSDFTGNKTCEEQIDILCNFLFKKYQQLMSDLEEMFSRKTLDETGRRRPIRCVLIAKGVVTDGKNGEPSGQGRVREAHMKK